jgi:hypothetical protein
MPKASLKPTVRQVYQSFSRSVGKQEIMDKIPSVRRLAAWREIAYFSVCSKSGAAGWLDIWDCDHLDGLADMRLSVAKCVAWFSHTGFDLRGNSQTATGRINCVFNATSEGDYACNVRIASYSPGDRSTVECLIDDSSFGLLSFTGTIDQPHFSHLTSGNHHFRIRQVNGGFFFINVAVYKIG